MSYIVNKNISKQHLISFSTIDDGNMWRSNENRLISKKNRNDFLSNNNIHPNSLFRIRPSHSANIDLISVEKGYHFIKRFFHSPYINTDFDHYYDGSDGILTFDRNYTVGLISGDCTPLIVIHETSGLHGIIHVGMLGALNYMVFGLAPIFEKYDIKIDDVTFYLGPSISKQDYLLSNSGLWNAISTQATNSVPKLNDFLANYEGGVHFDLHGMIIYQLEQIGASKLNIYRYNKSTADPNVPFYSHYKMKNNDENGRFFSIVKPIN